MLSEQAQQIIEMLRQSKESTRNVVFTPEEVLQARSGNDQLLGSMTVIPETIKCTPCKLGNINAEFCEYIGEDKKTGRIAMFIHGGGFMTGSIASRRHMCTRVLNYAKIDGYSIEYTQFPEGKHPQGLNDVLEAFCELQKLGHKPEDIYIFGESGGAMLCLMSTMWLKDHGMAVPGGICVVSPLINIKDEYPSRAERDERDPMIHGRVNHELDQYFTEEDKISPYVSTAYGDFKGFPKLSIHCGSEEVLYDDSIDLQRRCREAGVDAKLHVWDEMFHSFPILPCPEGEMACVEIGTFLSE